MITRIITISLLLLSAIHLAAQNRKNTAAFNSPRQNPNNTFLQQQWWLGIKAGTNLVQIDPVKRYSAVSPINYTPQSTDKTYGKYNLTGSQVAIEITYYYKGFSFSLQPGYNHSRFDYTNQYQWTDPENPDFRLDLNYYHLQKVNHAEIPLIIKYDILGNRLRPYVQAGAFYSFLLNASKEVEISGTDFASGGINQFTYEPVIVGARDLFASNYWGLLAGAGVNYNVGNIRLNLDVQYRKGMSLINSTENRFGNDRLSGIAEAMDDIKINAINIALGVMFPMRYLSSGFKTLDQR